MQNQLYLPRWIPLVALYLTSQVALVEAYSSDRPLHIERSYWYDWGWHGGYPRVSYESFGADSPFLNIIKQDDRCDDGYTFIAPRGMYVEAPAPVILDNNGNLVWTETKWGQAMDFEVQKYQGKDYITFWHGTGNGTFGTGSYLMVSATIHPVFKLIHVVYNQYQLSPHDVLSLVMRAAVCVALPRNSNWERMVSMQSLSGLLCCLSSFFFSFENISHHI